jgi:hypothetical protein
VCCMLQPQVGVGVELHKIPHLSFYTPPGAKPGLFTSNIHYLGTFLTLFKFTRTGFFAVFSSQLTESLVGTYRILQIGSSVATSMNSTESQQVCIGVE